MLADIHSDTVPFRANYDSTLDEPIVLFTVAGCTLLFGFVVGRGVQRRSNRRDLRLRL